MEVETGNKSNVVLAAQVHGRCLIVAFAAFAAYATAGVIVGAEEPKRHPSVTIIERVLPDAICIINNL